MDKQMNGPKIVFVGGGSYNWAPRIISDMLQTPELDGSEVWLLDINPVAAEEVKAAAEKMCATLNSNFSFIATCDEDSAFKGADFIIITISTGDLEMMRFDLKVPEKYGIYHTVGDSCGPGGWNRTLRNVPVFIHLAQKIETLAPQALILNYTNPMAALTATLYEVSSLRSVGLCHGLFAVYRMLQKIYSVEENDISLKFGGVNHFFWVTDFTIKGKSYFTQLLEALKTKNLTSMVQEKDVDEAGFANHYLDLCNELFVNYSILPYPGDRHTCECLGGYILDASELDRLNIKRTTIEERYETRAKARERAAELASGELAPYEVSRETAVDIMKSFITNEPFIDVVNLPNIGQIDNLPRGAVVETLGQVDARGFTPLAFGALPGLVQRLVEPHCNVQMMTLEAALKGDRELALQALMADPACAHMPPDKVRAMGRELMAATTDFLPQFK
jgi:galacturan 1,4-alpha-galacturonidase